MHHARSRTMPLSRLKRPKKASPKASPKVSTSQVGAPIRHKKRFRASSGGYAEVAVLDANTATFGSDLLTVFRENVAKARKENMRLFGSPDRVPKKD
jgi:hypothetical protein